MFNSRWICEQYLHSDMFNSCRIFAWILCYMGLMLAYSIPGRYVHHFDLYKVCAYMFNSRRICAQDLHSDFLDYFWMKDPLGMLEDSLGSMILLKSALGDDSDLLGSLDGVWLTEKEVAYWGLFDCVLFIGELLSTREMIIFFLLLNH